MKSTNAVITMMSTGTATAASMIMVIMSTAIVTIKPRDD